LLRGYTLNEKRLREKGLGEIEQAVELIARKLTEHALVTDEGRAVLEVVQQYTRAWHRDSRSALCCRAMRTCYPLWQIALSS
jgi:hypothetical protein